MKIRTIKPEFFSDEKVARLPIEARLLYIALWGCSDDNGTFKAHPAFVRSQAFPYDDIPVAEVRGWLELLAELGMVAFFTYDGETYGSIRSFREHQKLDPRYLYEIIPISVVESALSVDTEEPTSAHRAPTERPLGAHRAPTVGHGHGHIHGHGLDSHTQDSCEYNSNAHTREEEAPEDESKEGASCSDGGDELFEVLVSQWIPAYAPNLKALQPLTPKQLRLLLKSYELPDIARIFFDISGKTDPGKIPKGASVYATASKYLALDHRIRAQLDARRHNASLTPEGLARGTCERMAVPRTTRETNPELGYIFELTKNLS